MKHRLRVSDNQRYLTHGDGRPFFYLGDTAWGLFQRTTRQDADEYLRDRVGKGFNVIQAVVLSEFDGLRTPNAYGDLPLHDLDPTRPNEAYFRHVDWIIERATQLDLFVGLLPTWGDKWNRKWGDGPGVFTPANAQAFGQWLAQRYRDAPIIWILGGDRAVESESHRAIISATADGIIAGGGNATLMSFHPVGGHCSSEWFHREEWLDFNMWQSGHTRNRDNYNSIASTYALVPPKPCLDAEPGYEGHPTVYQDHLVTLTDQDVRKSAYNAVFAGACGHTYGSIYQCLFWTPQHPLFRKNWEHVPWREAMHLPGSAQMHYLRMLMESRPYFERVPDQKLIVEGQSDDPAEHIVSTRDANGSYAFVYVPTRRRFSVDTRRLNGQRLRLHWFNPRNGNCEPIGEVNRPERMEFTTPEHGPDWVLVLDDAQHGFAEPGRIITAGIPPTNQSGAR